MSDLVGKVLPKNTNISTYFEHNGKIFEKMVLPDGRFLIRIVHTWGDGEEINCGFEYSDGISRTGINPLHIVGIYWQHINISVYMYDINKFLKLYNKDLGPVSSGEGN